MRVTATDNFGNAFKATKKTVGEINVGFVGLKMIIPIGFDSDIELDEDIIDEQAIKDEARAEIDALMGKLAREVKSALDVALYAPVWTWNDGTRDIFDTGELVRSGIVTASPDGIVVSYIAPYANLVHYGGYIRPYGNKSARPVYLPGRPWIDSVLYGGGPVPQFDFERFFADNIK